MKSSTESLTSTRFETTVLAPTICYEEISTLVCGGCEHNDGWRRENRHRGHEVIKKEVLKVIYFFIIKYQLRAKVHLLFYD